MNDEQIVQLYLDRDQRAISETADQYGKKLQALSFKVVYDVGTAEECVNDTYLRAWNNIPPDSPGSHLYPYLARITRCLSIDRYRHLHAQKRDASIVYLSEEIDTCLMTHDSGEGIADQVAFTDSMNRFLEGLKKDHRCVFMRRYWYMDDVKEIAEFYGYSESKVKSMLMRTRNRLREHLLLEGFLVG
ncbi:MAG: RNA polymerase sigma factor [Eubacterium sp.]|nr:RNA polymerase sigma factor [Eubacterium sp.]